MSTQFKFKGSASILHLNTRKEGPDDDKELAVDVKFETMVDCRSLDFFDPALPEFLFLDSGAARNLMMGPITFHYEIEHYRMDAMGSLFWGCKVKKFSLQPEDGRKVKMIFQVSFKPSGDEIARLAE